MNELELVETMIAVYRRLMKIIGPHAKSQGLSMPDAMVLMRVYKRGPCRVSDLASDHGFPPSTLTGIIDRLVAGGWLERADDPDDRRAIILRGSPKIGEFVENAMRVGKEQLAQVFKDLPPGLSERLARDLKEVYECLERQEGKNP